MHLRPIAASAIAALKQLLALVLLSALVLLPTAIIAQTKQAKDAAPTSPITTNPNSTTQNTIGLSALKALDWTALAPKDWDPMKALKDLNLGQIRSDADPRAIAAMAAMRKAWDEAPIEPSLNGSNIKIEGFVVPLDMTAEAIGEFLLVPYFGACIHTPPPPANQIIHIVPKEPQKGLRAMETVSIEGKMETVVSNTSMGNAGYRIVSPKISIITR